MVVVIKKHCIILSLKIKSEGNPRSVKNGILPK